jgi:PAS domain S-box-containing protein
MKLGISGKLALSLIATALAVVLVVSAIRYHAGRLAIDKELNHTMASILGRLVISLEHPLAEGAPMTVHATLLAEFNNEDVASLAVWRWPANQEPVLVSAMDRRGRDTPQFTDAEPAETTLLSRRQKLHKVHDQMGLVPIGEVAVFLDPARARTRLVRHLLATSAQTVLIVGLLVIMLIFIANRYVVTPLEQLRKSMIAMEKAQGGEFGDLALINATPIPSDSPAFEELRLLGERFTRMAEAINSRQVALHNSEEKYRTLLENLPQRVFLKNADLLYLSCNENYARDLHLQPEQIVGRTDRDFYPRRVADDYIAFDQDALTSSGPIERDESYIVRGRRRAVRAMRVPLKNEDGRVWAILGIIWDITDQQ